MGQNLALNIAEKGFPISVYNRTTSIVDETLERAAVEGNLPVSGQYSPRDFILSLRPVRVLMFIVSCHQLSTQAMSTVENLLAAQCYDPRRRGIAITLSFLLLELILSSS
ncbi:hypothetical protein F2Q69_00032699 [Brassica cretica]|uniref:6-phosphogluconate dehydrogenase NADP-binding domain-containing protein n=1 Tax=Brassica cretica TaxID=69181 RepID=A0A8S9SFV0_BRACR|nr:hypothetical protein F2Q69_00032699 [Brassica cretica]